MNAVKKVGDWSTQWFILAVLVWAVLNLFFSQISVWAKNCTDHFMSIILFGKGLTLNIDDFKRIVKIPLMVSSARCFTI